MPAPDFGPTLERAEFVSAVLAVNPELDEARAALDAATHAVARVAAPPPSVQVRSTLSGMVSAEVDVPVPVASMLPFDRAMARAEADLAAADMDAMRLDLALMAAMAWAEDAMLTRELALLDKDAKLLGALAAAADSRVLAGMGTADALGARAEAAMLERRRIDVRRRLDDVHVRMLGLLHAPIATALPSPADEAPVLPSFDGPTNRPDVTRAEAEVRMADAAVGAARRAGVPMPMGMVGYDGMWPDVADRFMVGVEVDLPFLQARARRADVATAVARADAARAMQARTTDTAAVDLYVARRDVEAAAERLRLDTDTLVPLSHARLDAARAMWVGGGEFMPVLDAARMLVDAEMDASEARAALDEAIAAWERACGR